MPVNFNVLTQKLKESFPNRALLSWYEKVKRDLPWRETNDPYRIWLSEIILQQTRVEQGMPYYERFVDVFSDVHVLANASEDEVLKLWEGLGYYSRARNLHATAKHVSENLGGDFPDTHEGLLSLKGVGPYTAAAIGSIAFNLPVAAVDGNVYRVLARFFGITDSIDETTTKKQIGELAQTVLSNDRPGDHNQAMMELGATVCTPKQPLCETCPIQTNCRAFNEGLQSELPVRTKKTKVRNRYFYYKLTVTNGQVRINRRGEGDIWQGLYEFPLLESQEKLSDEQLLKQLELGKNDVVMLVSEEFKHILSHQRIYSRFVIVNKEVQAIDGKWVSLEELPSFAFPRLINRFLESESFVTLVKVFNI